MTVIVRSGRRREDPHLNRNKAGSKRECDRDSSWPSAEALARTVAILAAVAHPTRLAVLFALVREGALPVGRLQELSGTEQSALSHQLRVLREADLVRTTRAGRQVIYDLKDDHVAHIVEDALSHAEESG